MKRLYLLIIIASTLASCDQENDLFYAPELLQDDIQDRCKKEESISITDQETFSSSDNVNEEENPSDTKSE